MTTPKIAHQFERPDMAYHDPDPESDGWDTFTRIFAATLLPLGTLALVVIIIGIIASTIIGHLL